MSGVARLALAVAWFGLVACAVEPSPGGGTQSVVAQSPAPSAPRGPAPPTEAFSATVLWVSDGDTIGARTADRGEVRVRLIGIDAPETKRPGEPVGCYGPEASAELTRLLPKGTRVTAAYQAFRVDRYRRDLWDVWLPDGRLVQGVLVAGGFARAQSWGGTNRDASWLASLERTAQGSRSGLWGACPE